MEECTSGSAEKQKTLHSSPSQKINHLGRADQARGDRKCRRANRTRSWYGNRWTAARAGPVQLCLAQLHRDHGGHAGTQRVWIAELARIEPDLDGQALDDLDP